MKKQKSLLIRAVAVFGIPTVIFISGESKAATTTVRREPAPIHIQNNINITSRPQIHDTRPSPDVQQLRYTEEPAPVTKPVPAPAPVAKPVQRSEPVRQPAPQPAPRKAGNKSTIADPFFQPAQGNIGSVTEIGWSKNSYNFKIPALNPEIVDNPGGFFPGITGNWKSTSLYIKEDLSYGITDDLSIIGSITYSMDNFRMGWGDADGSVDKGKDSGFGQYGIGIQWQFMDSSEWIGYIGTYYQHQEMANLIILDTKIGKKVNNSTVVYGIGRLWGVNWRTDSYGNGLEDADGYVAYLALETEVDISLFIEGGVGVFTALDDQWSLELETLLGDYEWHSQLGISAKVSFQPTDRFSIGLLGRMSIWDSANSKDDIGLYMWNDKKNLAPGFVGNAKMKDYSDMSLGLRIQLYF
ncbi:MAG: hypothetical protein FWG80_02760 [Alphaproteobacteria bacterium]|nr:hypothetical protein [Alphaproteobacteria bacterium]